MGRLLKELLCLNLKEALNISIGFVFSLARKLDIFCAAFHSLLKVVLFKSSSRLMKPPTLLIYCDKEIAIVVFDNHA